MELDKIKELEAKVILEAENAIKAIYDKYDSEMVKLISEQLPKGYTLVNGNGMCIVYDEKGNEVETGSAWSPHLVSLNPILAELSNLQYSNEHQGSFFIPLKIEGSK